VFLLLKLLHLHHLYHLLVLVDYLNFQFLLDFLVKD
jgi:hypothetical protein